MFVSNFCSGTVTLPVDCVGVDEVGVDLVSIESNPPITIPAIELSSDEIGLSK